MPWSVIPYSSSSGALMSRLRRCMIQLAVLFAALVHALAVWAAEPPGELLVTSDDPGRVYLGGQFQGVTPVLVSDLAPGQYWVHVTYKNGRALSQVVFVQTDELARVRFGRTDAANGFVLEVAERNRLVACRQGIHFGFALSAPTLFHVINADAGFFGGTAGGIANIGLHPIVDLRLGIDYSLVKRQHLDFSVVGIPVGFRFHVSRFYSIELGLRGGTMIGKDMATPFLGPEWSALSFRFGKNRQVQIVFSQGIAYSLGQRDITSYVQTLSFQYLFLASSEPS